MAAGHVVVKRAGALRCVAAAEVADLLARAVNFDDAGLGETPGPGRASPVVPAVVEATVQLRHPARVSRLAARFLRRRLDGSATTLVLRSRTPPRPAESLARSPLLAAVAPIPVAEVAAGASFDLVVPVGEPDRCRYATPVVTLVVAWWLPPAIAARQLVEHRAFLGAGHCPGDDALLHMAASGQATPAAFAAALHEHESAVVLEMLQAVVRARS